MKNKDAFSAYHPLVNFLYFALLLLFTMFLTHPASLLVSLAASACYAAYLGGRGTLRARARYLLPMLLLAALVNPAFNHEGATVLARLPSGEPLTLESILCGLASAALLCAAIAWFFCYSAVMTSDKFIYLFGRVIPALSLVLSMTLRFVPRFRAQLKAVSEAQRCVGRDVSKGTARQRVKIAVTVLSVTVTWALENAVGTADSMKSRGYGLPGRSAFSVYRFDGRDRAALAWLCFCGLYLGCGWAAGGLYWRWYPSAGGAAVTPFTLSFQLAYLAMCLTPLIIDRREERVWKRLRSEI